MKNLTRKKMLMSILNFLSGGEEECDREYCTYCCVPETHGENGLLIYIADKKYVFI